MKGQDYFTVDTWYNDVLRWCSAKAIKLIGVGVDGDSKFHKYFTQRFLKNVEQQRRGNLETIPYESFDYVSVIEEHDNVCFQTGGILLTSGGTNFLTWKESYFLEIK